MQENCCKKQMQETLCVKIHAKRDQHKTHPDHVDRMGLVLYGMEKDHSSALVVM